MGKNDRQRAMRKAKKLARAAARKKQRRKQQQRIPNSTIADATGLSRAEIGCQPIYRCLVSGKVAEAGMGQVLITRKLPNGLLAMGMFLVDAYCLGVKNAFFSVITTDQLEDELLGRLRPHKMEDRPAPHVRKLIESAIEYARGLGFEPHPDFRDASIVLGDIDSSQCPDVFTFGKDGKPFYVNGPDTPVAESQRIIAQLTARLGPKGFHFLVGGPVSDSPGVADLDDDVDFEDEEFDEDSDEELDEELDEDGEEGEDNPDSRDDE